MSYDKQTVYGGGTSLKAAKEWTSNWRHWMLGKGVPPQDVLKGFFIPISDILNLAQEAELLNGARLYMALTDKNDPASVKVVLVRVGQHGEDIIEPIQNGNNKTGEDEDYTIYDVTSPCPPLCDPEGSALFPLPPPPAK
ncbi:MAG: hypothetical protein V4557_13495 [Bacteroidota bacterium]